MNEIKVFHVGSGPFEDEWDDELVIRNYPGPIGEAELYAIKTALEKRVALNAEVERLRKRQLQRPKES